MPRGRRLLRYDSSHSPVSGDQGGEERGKLRREKRQQGQGPKVSAAFFGSSAKNKQGPPPRAVTEKRKSRASLSVCLHSLMGTGQSESAIAHRPDRQASKQRKYRDITEGVACLRASRTARITAHGTVGAAG